jgi:uncharacterized iron-regulated membrane protein
VSGPKYPIYRRRQVRATLLIFAGVLILCVCVLAMVFVILIILWTWWHERRTDRRQQGLSEAEVADSIKPLAEVYPIYSARRNGGGDVGA